MADKLKKKLKKFKNSLLPNTPKQNRSSPSHSPLPVPPSTPLAGSAISQSVPADIELPSAY
jgi:hypothetical protein